MSTCSRVVECLLLVQLPHCGSVGQFSRDLFVKAVMTCIFAVHISGVAISVQVQRTYTGPGTQCTTFQVCHLFPNENLLLVLLKFLKFSNNFFLGLRLLLGTEAPDRGVMTGGSRHDAQLRRHVLFFYASFFGLRLGLQNIYAWDLLPT